MRLLHVITLRLSLLATLIMFCWSVFFYYTIMNEVNDEVDDSLEDYAEMIIIRSVRNEALPTASSGSNNQFFLREITPQYAAQTPHVRYEDRDVFIEEKDEFEPARVLTYIFQNDDGKFFELEVSTPHIDKKDLRGAIFYWIVFLFLAILLCILLLNLWTIGHSMRPLRKLLRWLDRYRVGEDNRPLDNPTKIYEFRKLNEVVKESIERTEVAYEQQKMFIGNASHEMQTPLAICSSRLEMLLEDPSLTERQMEEIVKTRQTLEQLSRMNRSLLLLTKIDNGQFADVADVNFTESIQRLLPDYEMVYASKNIRLQTELQGDFIVRMDESLAQTLLSNLLKNAFVHNHEGGEITIKATADSLLFENTGAPESLNRDYIFERFYHSSDNRQSLGLGLAVVKAICQRYGLRIDYAFNNGKHAFTIVKN
ncbi:MAG: HAMP domain-containing histidine kinase [Prevotella sp.]|nr:HAMP domain-containing histidine kinase [Prevotella sp.]